MWVKKILIIHTPQISKGKYLLSALPFPSLAEVVALPGSQRRGGETLREGVLGITLRPPPQLCSLGPWMLWENTGRFLQDWRKNTQELP